MDLQILFIANQWEITGYKLTQVKSDLLLIVVSRTQKKRLSATQRI